MGYTIQKYDAIYFDRWNRFVEESANGTLFHRLDFLNYHGDKFGNKEHHLMWLKGEAIVAVMPLLIDDRDKIAYSPYGGSFGGLVYATSVRTKNAIEMVTLLKQYLEKQQVACCKITLAPIVYCKAPSELLDFSLLQGGFKLYESDLFNVTQLPFKEDEVLQTLEGRARTTIKKYQAEFEILENQGVEDFYPILAEDKERHASTASHSFEELKALKEKFPERIVIDIAVHKVSKSRAGICYFKCSDAVIMTFYMAQENGAVRSNATNILVFHGMQRAVKEGFRWLDFGSSSYGYTIENPGVANFKESFGAQVFLRKKYVLNG